MIVTYCIDCMRYASLRRYDTSHNNCATALNDNDIGVQSYRISIQSCDEYLQLSLTVCLFYADRSFVRSVIASRRTRKLEDLTPILRTFLNVLSNVRKTRKKIQISHFQLLYRYKFIKSYVFLQRRVSVTIRL